MYRDMHTLADGVVPTRLPTPCAKLSTAGTNTPEKDVPGQTRAQLLSEMEQQSQTGDSSLQVRAGDAPPNQGRDGSGEFNTKLHLTSTKSFCVCGCGRLPATTSVAWEEGTRIV